MMNLKSTAPGQPSLFVRIQLLTGILLTKTSFAGTVILALFGTMSRSDASQHVLKKDLMEFIEEKEELWEIFFRRSLCLRY